MECTLTFFLYIIKESKHVTIFTSKYSDKLQKLCDKFNNSSLGINWSAIFYKLKLKLLFWIWGSINYTETLPFLLNFNYISIPSRHRLFSHDGKVRILNFNSRCAFWIKIQNTQKRPCVCQITSQNVIWNAHLKSRYRGVFQLRFSQITQRNLCMNDLTSESCFGGRS